MRPGRYELQTGFLSPAECDRFLASASRRRWSQADLYGLGGRGVTTVDRGFWDCRRTVVRNRWLLNRMDDLVAPLSTSIRFAVRKTEPAWWNRYGRGVGFQEHYDRISSEANPRVLSVVVMLSRRDAYAGGELFVAGKVVPLGQGDAVVFSSLTMHVVAPIFQGARDSLVRWYLGQ